MTSEPSLMNLQYYIANIISSTHFHGVGYQNYVQDHCIYSARVNISFVYLGYNLLLRRTNLVYELKSVIVIMCLLLEESSMIRR